MILIISVLQRHRSLILLTLLALAAVLSAWLLIARHKETRIPMRGVFVLHELNISNKFDLTKTEASSWNT